jgi:PAS domain S-box-containing protein
MVPPHRDLELKRLAAIAADLVALLGCLTLAGWIFDVERLRSFAPALGQMKGNTAIAFVLLGLAARLHAAGRHRGPAALLAGLAALLGLATLVEYVFGARLGIDQLLFSDPQLPDSPLAPGRMGAETAVGLLVGGGALSLWSIRGRGFALLETAALAIGVLGLLAVLGYVFGVPRLAVGFVGRNLTPISLQSSLAFLLYGTALMLAHPRQGLVALLRSPSAGGALIRRLLVPVIGLPILLGYLRLRGQDAGLYGTADGVALYTTAIIGLFGALVWQAARMIERYDVTLRIDEQRWRAIFDADRIGVVVRDPEFRLLECNHRFAEIFGFTPEELVGTSPGDIMGSDEAALAESTIPEAWDRPQVGLDFERSVTVRDGRSRRLRISVFPVSDAGGDPLYQVILVDDLTERRRLEDELAHTRRIESIGRLAGGIAHELNNKLAVILGFSDLIAKDLARDHPVQESLREVRAAAEHSAALTSDLLSFGRQQMLEPRPLVVSEICADLLRILRPALGGDVELVVEDDSDGACVMGDRAQLEQVLVNLALNARDAMPGGGRLSIRTGVIAPAADDADGPRRVTISISDTGVGMTDEVRERIFEPFFTTKEFGQGAGLGLATALGIVVQSGGRITVDSSPGHGTTVLVELPETAAPAGAAAGHPDEARDKGGLCVLLVEDEEQVRQLLQLLLEDAGHRVTSAAGGVEALRILRDVTRPIDLLLTDMVLGDVHGSEVARQARELRPELLVVYMSGYDGEFAQRGDAPPADGILAKPFTDRELASTLQEAVASR